MQAGIEIERKRVVGGADGRMVVVVGWCKSEAVKEGAAEWPGEWAMLDWEDGWASAVLGKDRKSSLGSLKQMILMVECCW